MFALWVDKKREVVYNFKYKSAHIVCVFCEKYSRYASFF